MDQGLADLPRLADQQALGIPVSGSPILELQAHKTWVLGAIEVFMYGKDFTDCLSRLLSTF